MRLSDLAVLPTLWTQLRHPRDYLRFRRTQPRATRYDIELRDGTVVRLRGPSRDFHVFHRIFIDDEYSLRDLDLAGRTVVDIGAHAGFLALRCALFGARVVCAEPAPDNLEALKHNIARNRLENLISVSETAICGAAGSVSLQLEGDPYSYQLTRGSRDDDGRARRISVEAMTLGTLIEAHDAGDAALLKLDCEGSEYEIISSAEPDLLRTFERIRLEYHVLPEAPDAVRELRERLKSAGFAIDAAKEKKNGRQGYLFFRRE